MIPELGHFCLILALIVAAIQGTVPLIGARTDNHQLMSLAKPAALCQFLLVLASFACLTYSFIINDFSVTYVAQTSNSQLPMLFRIGAVWGAHEGSMLLWILILTVWSAAVAALSGKLPLAISARVLAVMGLISVGFILFSLATSNPFLRLDFVPIDGRDLNPLLQDFGLMIHPPMLYMGYVGFSVAFSFAITALLAGQMDSTWARWTRPWTTMAWAFLSVGIALGSWWAYYELGWGGWWFWDPSENVSFLPWLMGTALIHSLAMTEKRGLFKRWTLLLALSTFALSLMGTFIIRSGLLTSVHAFASDPERGLYILMFLLIMIGSSLYLFLAKSSSVAETARFQALSRETLLLLNNVLLVIFAATVLLGTLYPLIIEALGLGRISVGAPYFNSMVLPLMLPLVLLMGIGPMCKWSETALDWLTKRLFMAFALSLAIMIIFMLWLKQAPWSSAAIGIGAASWVIMSMLVDLYRKSASTGFFSLPRSYLGMVLAHIGFAVTVTGITLVSNFEEERDLRMAVGEQVRLGAYDFQFQGVSEQKGPNYTMSVGDIWITKQGKTVAQLHPEKRRYNVQKMVLTEADIDPGFFRDLYVSLGEPLDNGAWSVKIYYKPFVRWLWLGAILMALGGIIAISDKRYRLKSRQPVQPAKKTKERSPDMQPAKA